MSFISDPQVELVLKLLLATALSMLIGLERERSHKAAGLRTHALVALGATLLTLTSIYGIQEFKFVNYDPSRIISNIIVGIGFIGGGAILRNGSRVTGTTTAASLWAVAAIGIAVGVGFYFAAVVTAAIVYIMLSFVWKLEKKMTPVRYEPLEESNSLSDEEK